MKFFSPTYTCNIFHSKFFVKKREKKYACVYFFSPPKGRGYPLILLSSRNISKLDGRCARIVAKILELANEILSEGADRVWHPSCIDVILVCHAQGLPPQTPLLLAIGIKLKPHQWHDVLEIPTIIFDQQLEAAISPPQGYIESRRLRQPVAVLINRPLIVIVHIHDGIVQHNIHRRNAAHIFVVLPRNLRKQTGGTDRGKSEDGHGHERSRVSGFSHIYI